MSKSAYAPPLWWTSAVFYQVYPRSYADGNGDGTGDLIGLRERLEHLVDLGVDAIWLSPFYRSPMADGGYDVSDPCDVDPLFGSLADFDAMLAAAHERGIRVTVDLVPNHFSSQHPWFRAVLTGGPDAPERERFVIRAGRGANGDEPPNNWPSNFGGPAWTRLPDGEWYLHLFAPEQPDLNWANPEVPAEFERIERFWLDRGVDGFRVDVGHSMAKEPGLPDMDLSILEPYIDGIPARSELDPRWDREQVHEYHRALRRVLDSYPGDRMAVGEVYVANVERLARYVRPDELNLTFNFELIEADWAAEDFHKAIETSLTAMAAVGATCTWVLGNHDTDRPATRYGGGARGVRRARAAALVQLSLPGAAYIFNGDELGLANAPIPPEAIQDPQWELSGHARLPRDGERVPLPWSGDAPPYGFTTAPRTYLPMPDDWAGRTVAAESADPESTLHLYQQTVRLRRTLPELQGTDVELIDAPFGCIAYRRGGLTVCLNTGEAPVPMPAGELVHASGPVGAELPPDTAVWIRPSS